MSAAWIITIIFVVILGAVGILGSLNIHKLKK